MFRSLFKRLFSSRVPQPIVVSPATCMSGSISSSDAVVVRGEFSGAVKSPALSVDRGGRMLGEADVRDLVVNGQLVGKIHCESAFFGKDAWFYGELKYKNLHVSDGANVYGRLSSLNRAASGRHRLGAPVSAGATVEAAALDLAGELPAEELPARRAANDEQPAAALSHSSVSVLEPLDALELNNPSSRKAEDAVPTKEAAAAAPMPSPSASGEAPSVRPDARSDETKQARKDRGAFDILPETDRDADGVDDLLAALSDLPPGKGRY